MKVTFLATLPPGSSTLLGRTLPLARALAGRGHRVTLLTLGASQEPPQDSEIAINVVGPTLRGNTPDRPTLPDLARGAHRGTQALTRALATADPDVVVLVKAHPQNVLASRSVTCPLILDADDDERWASRLSWIERRIMGWTEQRAARKAELVTACSPILIDRYTLELRARRVALLPTGIPPDAGRAPDLRSALHLPASARLVLYLGSLALSSGHRVDDLLNVWDALAAEVSDLHLVIAGDGIDAERLREIATRLTFASRVHFTGRFAPQEAEGLARQATLLVDPVDRSKASEAKSSSRTLLALKTGVPIVAGNVGIRKLFLPPSIHSWTLYPPEHRDRFLRLLKHGLTEKAREQFRKDTAGLWKQWSWERLGPQFAALVENILP